MLSIDFSKLSIPVSENVFNYTQEQQHLIYQYLNQLDDHHKQAYLIAKSHLGTSFNIMKSNGYKEWLSSKINNNK